MPNSGRAPFGRSGYRVPMGEETEPERAEERRPQFPLPRYQVPMGELPYTRTVVGESHWARRMEEELTAAWREIEEERRANQREHEIAEALRARKRLQREEEAAAAAAVPVGPPLPPPGPPIPPPRPRTPPPARPAVSLASQLRAAVMVRAKRKEKEAREKEERERKARELREYREREIRETREREQARKEKEKRRKANAQEKKRKAKAEEEKTAEERKAAEKKKATGRAETRNRAVAPRSPVLNLQRLLRGGGSTALARQSPTPTTPGSSRPACAAASTRDSTSEPSTSSGVTDRNRASLGLTRPSGPPGPDNRVEIMRTPPPMTQRPVRPILPLMALLVPRPPELGPAPPQREPRRPRRNRPRIVIADLYRFPDPCEECGQPGHPAYSCPTNH